MSVEEFATLCRERCGRPANAGEGTCGEEIVASDGDRAWLFCGRHMLAFLDENEEQL